LKRALELAHLFSHTDRSSECWGSVAATSCLVEVICAYGSDGTDVDVEATGFGSDAGVDVNGTA
jgi:hypothetical protein